PISLPPVVSYIWSPPFPPPFPPPFHQPRPINFINTTPPCTRLVIFWSPNHPQTRISCIASTALV
ncbi:hypothetical protein CRM22_001058, partial [Opisthorchis felineus]